MFWPFSFSGGGPPYQYISNVFPEYNVYCLKIKNESTFPPIMTPSLTVGSDVTLRQNGSLFAMGATLAL